MKIPDYKGFAITLNQYFKFIVLFPEENEKYVYGHDSLALAQAAIDAYLAREAKQKKAKNTTHLPYVGLLSDKNVVTVNTGFVKGFHAGNGYVLTLKGEMPTYSWYPDVPGIRQRLERLATLQTETQAIDRELKPYSMSNKVGYGRTAAENYDDVLQGMIKQYETKREKAQEMFGQSLKEEGEAQQRVVQLLPGLKVTEV